MIASRVAVSRFLTVFARSSSNLILVSALGLTTAALLSIPLSAQAGEGLFSRVYTVETVPEGHGEVEQLIRNRSVRAYGDYSAYDLRTEVEYGITDKFQAAFYVNTGYINAHGAPDDDDKAGSDGAGFSRNRFFLQGFSMEFLYRVLNPVTDAIGLAFYLEPEFNVTDPHNGLPYSGSMGNEYRMLLQKNFFGDQVILAYNAIIETEFIRFRGQDDWSAELDYNNELGATYRFRQNWYAGLEFRNHNELGGFAVHEHSVYWLGPVVHFANEKYWATLGLLAQVYGDPNGTMDDHFVGNGLFLRSHEKYELTLKASLPF